MIEPQNTIFPVPADPRPIAEDGGDATAFGDMLAQLVATAGQVDPAAIQAIAAGPHQGQNAFGDAESDSEIAPNEVLVSAPSGERGESPVAAATGFFGRRNDRVAPKEGEATNVAPDTSLPDLPAEPHPTISFRQTGDGIWEPALAGHDEGAQSGGENLLVSEVIASIAPPVSTADSGSSVEPSAGVVPAPLSTEVQPRAASGAPSPPVEPVATGPQPIEIADVAGDRAFVAPQGDVPPQQGAPTGVTQSETRVAAGNVPKDPPTVRTLPQSKPDRRLPVAPAHTSLADQVAASIWGEARGEAAAPPARIDVDAGRAVRLDGSHPVPLTDDSMSGFEPARPLRSTADMSTAPAFVIPASGSEPVSTRSVARPGESPILRTSALAERVMQAIDLQRTQPPPRSMVVDIPEVEGLRLVVSVRSGGHVAVTPAAGSPDAAFAPFADDLSRVLAERGFVMNGEDRGRGYHPYENEDETPIPMRRPGFERVRTDNDLRI